MFRTLTISIDTPKKFFHSINIMSKQIILSEKTIKLFNNFFIFNHVNVNLTYIFNICSKKSTHRIFFKSYYFIFLTLCLIINCVISGN